MTTPARSWCVLVYFAVLVACVSALGGAITATSVNGWFLTLAKPSWNPPGWLFGPVWTTLYAMMAFVAWRLWLLRPTTPAARLLLGAWFVQLALNAAWSFLFFGLRSPLAGILDIVPLLALLVWIGTRLWTLERRLAWLWLPYVLWVAFATALNGSIWYKQAAGL